MPVSYDDIAGTNVGRLANLSDSIFGVAMTLLILEIGLPTEYIKTERELWEAIFALSPRLLVYFMSFLTLGIFWNAQQVQLSRLARGDRKLTWIHIAFLATVAVTPLSTALEENFIHLRVALAVFWVNPLLLGLTLYASWRYASASGPPAHRCERRGTVHHQAPYHTCGGALYGSIRDWDIQHALEHCRHCRGPAQLRRLPDDKAPAPVQKMRPLPRPLNLRSSHDQNGSSQLKHDQRKVHIQMHLCTTEFVANQAGKGGANSQTLYSAQSSIGWE